MIKYISPSSLSAFYNDRTSFYLERLSPNKLPRLPQTNHMSVGSAFDAYVKSYLVGTIYGNSYPEFEFDTLFEAQVEKQNRDYANKWGEKLFKVYKDYGGLANLMMELKASDGEPRFEREINATVDGIPMMGKPDLNYVLYGPEVVRIIHDWKITSVVSPKPHYVMARYNGNRKSPISYKDAHVENIYGIDVNIACNLEDIQPDWANQLTIYNWIDGASVGSAQIGSIDLLTDYLNIDHGRVVSYRNRIGEQFQLNLFQRIKKMWEKIQDDWIFDDMTQEESQEYCRILDSNNDPVFRKLTLGR
mgnify:FL=1